MKTILVTGGAGFIGSNFIYLILNECTDRRVVCVDALTYAANIHTLDEAFQNPRFVFYREDIRNREEIFRIFEKERPDEVVNFAAESHVDRSIENPEIFLGTNMMGAQVIMDACLKYGVKRFHQVGTDEVYGELPLERPDLLFSEKSPLHPSSPYSVSKAGADMLALAYHRTYGLPVTISRCSNNYGPFQFPEKLIPLMIYNAQKNKKLPIYGDGKNIRDWLFVKDHCYGILAILERGRTGEVYNLGGQNEKSNLELVKKILKELGKDESLISYVEDRKGHDLRYAIDAGKARSELGWEPVMSFEEGIRFTIQWYLEHTEWMDTCCFAQDEKTEQ